MPSEDRQHNKYVLVQSDHPKSINGKYYEHVLIIEKCLGRSLSKNESIHHINEIKNDNRIENLFVCSRLQHDKAHGMKTVSQYKLHSDWISKKCSKCGKVFYGNPKTIKDRKRCSVSCKSIRVDKQCVFCGNMYTVPIQQSHNWVFCSRLCKRKANNDAGKK